MRTYLLSIEHFFSAGSTRRVHVLLRAAVVWYVCHSRSRTINSCAEIGFVYHESLRSTHTKVRLGPRYRTLIYLRVAHNFLLKIRRRPYATRTSVQYQVCIYICMYTLCTINNIRGRTGTIYRTAVRSVVLKRS